MKREVNNIFHKFSPQKIYINQSLNELFNIELSVTAYLYSENQIVINIEIISDSLSSPCKIKVEYVDKFDVTIEQRIVHIINNEKFDGIDAFQFRLNSREDLTNISALKIFPTNDYLQSADFKENLLPLVGLDYGNRRTFVNMLEIGKIVFLKREETNPYDSNAIAVFDEHNNHLGYIARDCAAVLNKFVKNNLVQSSMVSQIKRKSILLYMDVDILVGSVIQPIK